ncbi:GNAT family N-acetyltransferase [Bradyrhizobium elkanii]
MIDIRIFTAEPGTIELVIYARLRVNAFSIHRTSFEEELRSLQQFVSDQSLGVLLVAKDDSEPIGTCLMVESEFEPNHDVAPWLTGLFIVPEHRNEGAGSILVRAIEDQARQRGFSRLNLYTSEATGFYARLGWSIADRTNWRGVDAALMVREL